MAFQAGLSGLNSATKNLDVIGNNIANAQTVGMKSSRVEFSALVSSALGAGDVAGGGIGVSVATVAQQFSQGNINITGNNLDVAINGSGFFQVQMPDDSKAYTRDGQFKLDALGNIVTNSGGKVMGYTLDPATGVAKSVSTSPLSVPTGGPLAAKATTTVTAAFNLPALSTPAAGTTPPTPMEKYATSINAFDSQGAAVPVKLYFVNVGPGPSKADAAILVNRWAVFSDVDKDAGYAALVADAALVAPEITANNKIDKDNTALNAKDGGSLPTYANGLLPRPAYSPLQAADSPLLLEFDSTGKLVPGSDKISLTLRSQNPVTGTVDPVTGLPGTFAVSLDLSKATQYGTSYSINDLKQDGYTSGDLTGVNIDASGFVTTTYSNGQTQVNSQIALSDFRNVQGLAPVGSGNWVETSQSGQPIQGIANTGKFGQLRAGALEESNVDLTAELVNMMTAQRSYQANVQTIKTQDQALQSLVNLR